MSNEMRKDVVVINVTNVANIGELHKLLKNDLEFPEFYGMNWNAFWDSITGLVELPNSVIFEGWNHLENLFPEDARIMRTLFNEMNEMYPTFSCEVKYN